MSIANQGFPAFRADLNDALPALASNNSGATEPSTRFAHQWWVDTSANPSVLKQRNADNDAWITFGTINQTGDTFSLVAESATLSGGTANGVTYLNGSKVLTSGSALTYSASTLSLATATSGFTGIAFSNGVASPQLGTTGTGFSYAGVGANETWLYSGGNNLTIGSDGNYPIKFVANGSEQMRLTSTGLGIGTTSPSGKLEVSGSLSAGHLSARVSNTAADGYSTLWLSPNNDGIIRGGSSAGAFTNQLAMLTSGATPITFSTNNAERLRIDSSGNLLVGQTTAAVQTGSIVTAQNLEITKTVDADGAALGQLSWVNNTNAGVGSGTSFAKDVTCIKGLMDGTGNNSGGYLTFETKADAGTRAERMRIDSSGNLLVGTTTSQGQVTTASSLLTYNYVSVSIGNQPDHFLFKNDGTTTGSITRSGATGVAYNTSSDYRLKEDWQPMTGASERVQALKPVNFAWKVDGSRVDGFLAHEAQEVVPECVTGTKDAVDAEGKPNYQGIDQSKLVPLLTAALQEALTKIDSLTARITALEGN